MSSTLTNLTAATTWSGTDLFYALVGGNSRKIAAAKFLVAETSSSLAMQDSTTAQTFRVYRTFTDSSNYERLAIYSSAAAFEFKVETAGTGTDDMNLQFYAAGTGTIYFRSEVNVNYSEGLPSGGSTGLRLTFGSTGGFGIYAGTGAPTINTGTGQGSLYLRNDGSSSSTRLYVSAGGSTWIAVTTAS